MLSEKIPHNLYNLDSKQQEFQHHRYINKFGWGDNNKTFITLSYTGSGYISGSYSGSVPTNNNAYGQLRFYPEGAIGHTQGKFVSN